MNSPFGLLSRSQVIGFLTGLIENPRGSADDTPAKLRNARYSTSITSLGRHVCSNHGSIGPYIRRMVKKLFPGIL